MRKHYFTFLVVASAFGLCIPAIAETPTVKPIKPSQTEKVSGERLKKACPRGQKWDATSGSCVASSPGEKATPIPLPGPR